MSGVWYVCAFWNYLSEFLRQSGTPSSAARVTSHNTSAGLLRTLQASTIKGELLLQISVANNMIELLLKSFFLSLCITHL